jgi:hypothetical protein
MSSAIKITLTRDTSDTPTVMTVAEFREFMAGVEEFATARIIQDGIRGVVSDTTANVRRRENGEYVCNISAAGFSAQRSVSRANLLATLRDGYGIWSL